MYNYVVSFLALDASEDSDLRLKHAELCNYLLIKDELFDGKAIPVTGLGGL
jgi:hypothetical protein